MKDLVVNENESYRITPSWVNVSGTRGMSPQEKFAALKSGEGRRWDRNSKKNTKTKGEAFEAVSVTSGEKYIFSSMDDLVESFEKSEYELRLKCASGEPVDGFVIKSCRAAWRNRGN